MKKLDAIITITLLIILILFGLFFASSKSNIKNRGLTQLTPTPQPSTMTAIYGLVTTPDGKPLPGITVVIDGIGSTTKEDGSYMVVATTEGEQSVLFKDLKTGRFYQATNGSRISVTPGQSLEKNFSIKPIE